MEYYTEEATSSLNNVSESGASEMNYEEEGEDDFCRYRKEQIFQEIDFMKRKTKIACTLGQVHPHINANQFFNRPASSSVNKIIALFDAGMSVARFNMAHGTFKVSGLQTLSVLFPS